MRLHVLHAIHDLRRTDDRRQQTVEQAAAWGGPPCAQKHSLIGRVAPLRPRFSFLGRIFGAMEWQPRRKDLFLYFLMCDKRHVYLERPAIDSLDLVPNGLKHRTSHCRSSRDRLAAAHGISAHPHGDSRGRRDAHSSFLPSRSSDSTTRSGD